MPSSKLMFVFTISAFMAGCGEGANDADKARNATNGSAPATQTDSDPTPQTGTGGSGQSRP